MYDVVRTYLKSRIATNLIITANHIMIVMLSLVLVLLSLCIFVNSFSIESFNNGVNRRSTALFSAKKSCKRREVFEKLMVMGSSGLFVSPAPSNAISGTKSEITFEGLPDNAAAVSGGKTIQSNAEVNDEITIEVSKADLLKSSGLGIELGEVEFRTNRRVVVKSVAPDSVASRLGIQKDWVFVSVNGQMAERTNAEGVAIMVSKAVRDKRSDASDVIELRFRDPFVFREKLQSIGEGDVVTTQVAPAGDTTQRNADGSVKLGKAVTDQTNQKFTVTQLTAPKFCTRGATTDDLLEISYIGTVLETGQVFDGSSAKINGETIPGRGGDVSLYFVLGKQPFGQFPPGWDVGLEGICVGERRRLLIPPVLAYGSTGLPRRNIPPNATLQYDVTLLSLNGLATPQ